MLARQERGQQVVIHDAKATVKEVGTKPIITTAEINEEESVPFTTEIVEREDLYEGHEQILNPGKDGLVRKTIKITYTKGQETGREVVSTETVIEMEPKQVEKGTKKIIETTDYHIDEAIPFATQKQSSADLYTDETKLVQNGEEGILRKFYRKTFNRGQEVSNELLRTETIKPAKDKIELVGTKPIVEVKQEEQVTVLPFKHKEQESDALYVGEKKTIQQGVDGKKTTVYEVTYERGVEKSRRPVDEQTVEAKAEIVEVGTKPVTTTKEITEDVIVPFTTEIIKREDWYQDQQEEVQAGKNGLIKKTFKVTYTKGEETNRELIKTETIEKMQIQKIEQGVKVRREPTLVNAPPVAWILNKGDQTFVIRINSDLANLQKVTLNGQLLADGAYTAEQGSTVINLKPAYLNRLAPGWYTLEASFKEGGEFKAGVVKYRFAVQANAGSETGNQANEAGHSGSTTLTKATDKSTTTAQQKDQSPKTGEAPFYPVVSASLLLLAVGISLFLKKERQQ